MLPCLTHCQSNTLKERKDSLVSVKYKYLVAANKAYIELKWLKKIEQEKTVIIGSQEQQIGYLMNTKSILLRKDSISSEIIKRDSVINVQLERMITDLNSSIKKQKIKKWFYTSSLPIAISLTAVITYYFTKD